VPGQFDLDSSVGSINFGLASETLAYLTTGLFEPCLLRREASHI
jgi:hypothetical protein